jgi:hypothetical protein
MKNCYFSQAVSVICELEEQRTHTRLKKVHFRRRFVPRIRLSKAGGLRFAAVQRLRIEVLNGTEQWCVTDLRE